MTQNTTKVVSARLPLVDYLQLVEAAAERKMNLADLLLLRLFADPDPSAKPLQQANQNVQQLTNQVTTLAAKNIELSQATQAWQKHADTLQQTQQATATELLQANRQLEQLRQELMQQQAQQATLTQQRQTAQAQSLADQKRLQDLRQALIQADEDASTRLGQLGDKYWALVDHFIPPKSK